MQTPVIASVIICLSLLALRSVSPHAIDGRDHVVASGGGEEVDQIDTEDDTSVVRKDVEARVLDLESIFGGIAKSMVSRTGGTSSQLLSLNLSNIVLMLVLKGLIWGASYMQGNKGRNEGGPAAHDTGFTETDMLLFLGYLVADDSGRNDCLNRVACEHPARAEGYLRSAEMVWKTAKMLDGVVPLDDKYERMLIKLQEAIEDGRADGDCPAKYKCTESTNTEEEFNLI